MDLEKTLITDFIQVPFPSIISAKLMKNINLRNNFIVI